MRKTLISLIVSAFFATAASAQSRIEELTVHSEILNADKTYSVYLPDGYDTATERFPVLYLLHGAFGQDNNWHKMGNLQAQADEAIKEGRVRPMIVIMPDARGTAENLAGENMGYFNVEGWRYEDFFFQEFIPHIDATLKTLSDKENRAIAGLSMGGGGSVVYGQQHPEMFGAVYSVSGLLDNFPKGSVSKSYAVPFLWSVVRTSPVEFLQTAKPAQIEALRTIRWFVDCGDTDFLIRPNLNFFSEMMRAGVPLEFRVRDGAHSWKYWTSAVPMILEHSFPVKK
ncbi:MAG: esterase family protein [Rikenellaceae bacterium]|nr:esterase family protein [Rikenellaceae bacterium]